MFTYTRIVRFKNVGSMISGLPVCVQIVEHMKKNYGTDAGLMTPMLGGHPARCLFVFRADSLAKVEADLAKTRQDKEWAALVVKLGEFIDGTATNDQLWQTVV